MLEIRLLGSPVVAVDGKEIDFDTRKAVAIIAYLTVEGGADRDFLATMFWADSAPDRARAALRRTLSAARAGIGADVILADRTRVRLSDGYRCDVDELDEAIAETTTHGHDPGDVCEMCIGALTRGAELYRGDFLGSFSIREAPDFDDWARTVTESLRLKVGEVFRRLAHAHAAAGDYPAATAAANRWVALDVLHEPAHRLVMLLKAWAGDRAGAMQAYRDCVAILDRELGVAPLEETTELFEAILDEDLPPAPGTRRSVKSHPAPARPTAPTVMLDRVEAIGLIEHALESSRRSSQLVTVSGDSWMGKTRLLQHLSERARTAGHGVVKGAGFRAETDLPYGLAIQLLDGLLGLLEDSPEGAPQWAMEELARLLPRISPGRVAPDAGDLGELRLRDAFLTLVETVASRRPLLLVVDDAQWIDAASAQLVAHLGRRGGDFPLLVVISARTVDSLHPSLGELVTDEGHVALLPLRVEDLAAEHPGVDIAHLIRSTGGIPLLVNEALESGSVGADSSSVTRYIESRRMRLSDLARQVMTAAAVLDGMCDAGLLRDTSGRTEEEIVEAVEELVRSGLLREEDDRLGFTLDVLERVTYDSTSLVRRRLLHKRAAAALESRSRSRMDARMATAIAGHLRQAGDDGAAEWYRLAGDLGRRVYANREAATAYETALALGHDDVGAIHLALGELATAMGDYDAAGRELQAAAAQSEGATLALIEHRIGDLNRILGRFDLAEESFARVGMEHPRKADLYADWALLRHRLGDDEGARDLAFRAVGVAETAEQNARALNVLGLVATDRRDAMAHIDRALELSESMAPGRMAALNNKAYLLAPSDTGAAIELVREAIDIAARAGYRHQQAALLNHLADLNHRAGHRTEAEAALTEAVTIFADIDSGDWRPEVWLLRQW
jgi:DNA-binding SARP family transcriptional activator/tetratricopeptide (TPR) repeat protein